MSASTSGGECVVVEIAAQNDSDAVADLRFELHSAVAAGARRIVVDASQRPARLPAAALAAMVTAHRACRRRGGRLAVRQPSRRATEQLRRNGLWRVFGVDPGSAPAAQGGEATRSNEPGG